MSTEERRLDVSDGRTAEQWARDLMEDAGWDEAQCCSAGDVVAIANRLRELEALASTEPAPEQEAGEREAPRMVPCMACGKEIVKVPGNKCCDECDGVEPSTTEGEPAGTVTDILLDFDCRKDRKVAYDEALRRILALLTQPQEQGEENALCIRCGKVRVSDPIHRVCFKCWEILYMNKPKPIHPDPQEPDDE